MTKSKARWAEFHNLLDFKYKEGRSNRSSTCKQSSKHLNTHTILQTSASNSFNFTTVEQTRNFWRRTTCCGYRDQQDWILIGFLELYIVRIGLPNVAKLSGGRSSYAFIALLPPLDVLITVCFPLVRSNIPWSVFTHQYSPHESIHHPYLGILTSEQGIASRAQCPDGLGCTRSHIRRQLRRSQGVV